DNARGHPGRACGLASIRAPSPARPWVPASRSLCYLRHLENDVQLDRGAERKACDAIDEPEKLGPQIHGHLRSQVAIVAKPYKPLGHPAHIVSEVHRGSRLRVFDRVRSRASYVNGCRRLSMSFLHEASPALDERCKGGLDFAVAADIEDDQLLPDRLRGGQQVSSLRLYIGTASALRPRGDYCRCAHDLVQQLQSLFPQHAVEKA